MWEIQGQGRIGKKGVKEAGRNRGLWNPDGIAFLVITVIW